MFIHLCTAGYFGSFHFLAIVDSTALNICVQIFENLFSLLLGICLRVQLPGQMLTLCLTLWRTTKNVFHSSCTIYIPISNAKEFQSLHMLPKFVMLFFVYTFLWVQFGSVQFSRSVVSYSLQPYELQHARPPCPSPTPGVHPNPCPSSR